MAFRTPQDYTERVSKSVFRLPKEVKTTILTGVNYPIHFKRVYAHDNFHINVASLIQSNALEAPLMDSYKLRLTAFLCPFRNYYRYMDNNTKSTTSDILTMKRHTIRLRFFEEIPANDYQPKFTPQYSFQSELMNTPDAPHAYAMGVPRGGVLDFLGLTPNSFPLLQQDGTAECLFTAERLLSYLDTIRTYYYSKQENSIPYLDGTIPVSQNMNPQSISGGIRYIPVVELDDFIASIRMQKSGVTIDPSESTSSPLAWSPALVNYFNCLHLGAGAGLFLAMFEPDLYSNFLNPSVVGQVQSSVEVVNGTVRMHDLYYKNKLQKLIDRYDVSGGKYSSWMRTVWGSSVSATIDAPRIVGSITTVVNPSTITSQSNTGLDGSPIGEMAGNVDQFDGSRGSYWHIKTNEPGYLMVMAQLIPIPTYSDGIDPDLYAFMQLDDYTPQFQRLGWQDSPRAFYSAIPETDPNGILTSFDSSSSIMQVAAKNIAWLHLMTDVNRSHGEMAHFGKYNYWTIRRNFVDPVPIKDSKNENQVLYANGYFNLSRYINPYAFQYMFAERRVDTPNFFLQVAFQTKALRPLGKRYMPSME